MNNHQRKVLITCGALIGLMLLYPPFQIMGRGLGYAWIFHPPHDMAIINAGQLFVQWVAVVLLGGVAFLLMKDNPTAEVQSNPPITNEHPPAKANTALNDVDEQSTKDVKGAKSSIWDLIALVMGVTLGPLFLGWVLIKLRNMGVFG